MFQYGLMLETIVTRFQQANLLKSGQIATNPLPAPSAIALELSPAEAFIGHLS